MEGGYDHGKKPVSSPFSTDEEPDRKKRKAELSGEAVAVGTVKAKESVGQVLAGQVLGPSYGSSSRYEPRLDVASTTNMLSSPNLLDSPQDETSRLLLRQAAEMRIREQNIANERDVAERLAAARSKMSPVRSGRNDSIGSSDSNKRNDIADTGLLSHFLAHQALSNPFSMSSLLYLEQQQQLLRQQGLLNSVGIFNRLYPGVDPSVLVRTFGATTSGLGSLPDDMGAFATLRSQSAIAAAPLPLLSDLSTSERSRLLAVQELMSRDRQPHSVYFPSSLLSGATSAFAQPITDMAGRTIPESVASSRSNPGDLNTLNDLASTSATRSKSFPSAHATEVSQGNGNTTIFKADLGVPLSKRLPMPIKWDTAYRPPHFLHRLIVPLASEEDQNWLSEMLCFVRSDIVEIFRAQEMDIRSRNSSKRIHLGQIGIRCKFCAHLPKGSRAGRSASFPSSLDRIYQSLTMMLRDHFGKCTAMPPAIQEKFLRLKRKTTQGATDSKLFWVHSAEKMGLVDSEEGGIWLKDDIKTTRSDGKDEDSGKDAAAAAAAAIDDAATMEASRSSSPNGDPQAPISRQLELKIQSQNSTGLSAPRRPSELSSSSSCNTAALAHYPDGSKSNASSSNDHAGESTGVASLPRPEEAGKSSKPVQILLPADREIISPFLFALLSQIDVVYLEESERVGNRKSLPVGIPGLCCRHCDRSGRKGLCRVFPARRRNLPSKVYDLYDHFMKCNLCPLATREELRQLKQLEVNHDIKTKREERGFFGELWTRMGHQSH